MKQFFSSHKYLVIIIFSLILLAIILLLGMLLRNRPATTPFDAPAPTAIPEPPQQVEYISAQPDDPSFPITTPQPFTGAIEITPPSSEEIDSINQEWNLRDNPFTSTDFNVEYDYSQDMFAVTLNAPISDNLEKFNGWRLTNYPGIAEDRFQLK